MEDGAPIHRSKALVTSRENHKIEKLMWPTNSPNLNPIENVWKMLKDCVQKKCKPKNQTEMWMSVEVEWMAIPQSKLESLVASMLVRIKGVVATWGGTHVGNYLSFLLGFLALAQLFLSLIGKGDDDIYVCKLICVSKCQIMKIIFFSIA